MLMVPCVVGNLEFIMSSWPHHVRISLLWWEIIDTEIVYWGSLYHCQCVLTAFMNSVGPVEIATHNDSIFFARHCLFLLLNVTSQAHTTHHRVQGYSYRLHSEISIVWPIPKVLNNLSSDVLLCCQNVTSIVALYMNTFCLILQGLQVKFAQQLWISYTIRWQLKSIKTFLHGHRRKLLCRIFRRWTLFHHLFFCQV